MRVVRNWLVVVVLLGGVPATAANPRNIDAGPGINEIVTLQQNWTDTTSNWFYNVPQGSRLVPYDWFLHIEQATEQKPFRDADHIRSLGYIARTKDNGENKDGLPIGFIRDGKFTNGADALGLTCAACHTSLIVHGSKGYLVDGGPGMGDLEELLKRLTKSLEATATDDAKFERFAAKIFPSGGSPTEKADLRESVQKFAADRAGYNGRNLPKNAQGRFGHGRVDAFGAIFNEVTVTFLGIPENWHAADAPVSYPCLWDTPQHDRVQWNGAARNQSSPLVKFLFNTEKFGALGRNAGEVLGVFGFVEVSPTASSLLERYRSTVNHRNLIDIEDSLAELWSPEWPFGGLNQAAVDRGKVVFEQNCARCHKSINRKAENREVIAQMANVGTDSKVNDNFMQEGRTGRLEGRPEALRKPVRLGSTAPIPVILKHVVERVVLKPTLSPAEIRTLVARAASGAEASVTLDSLSPDFQVTATIEIGGKKLSGQLDSIKKVGDRLNVSGGHFWLTDSNRREIVDLSSVDNVRKAADRLTGLLHAAPGDAGATLAPEAEEAEFSYKARPLNGVWATAPYLHNGSVRTLAELLAPVDKRAKKFRVGSRTFDPVGVGFADDPTMPELDTAVPGNNNKGHTAGTELKDNEKKDLLEYLKSL